MKVHSSNISHFGFETVVRSAFAASASRARRSRRVVQACAVAAVGLLAFSRDASASGFATARFGGEHGHPTTDNPTALYYNPAGIALSEGTHVFVDATLALRFASYDRPQGESTTPSQEMLAPGANDGKATLFNAIASPFVGLTSDFGTDWIYGLSLIHI